MTPLPVCRTCGSLLSVGPSGTTCRVCALRSAGESIGGMGPLLSGESLPTVFGDFDLLEEVGHGGMGIVYKARERSLNRIVAIKVLLTGRFSDQATRVRFQREAESAARLQHPNIVAVHEVGEDGGHPYLTMDFVDGQNLEELCGGNPLSSSAATEYVRDIARAVQSAHENGILHRDLKPSNVLVGADGRPLVTDFGLAKWVGDSSDLTMTGQMLGSPNYTAPEQASARAAEVGIASDIYGLGAMLYHLLTGRPPYSAPTPTETLRLVLDTEPVSPRLLNPGLSRDLETICLKCLHKNPDRRYTTAGEVADELDRVLADRPIRARPAPAIELGWRWCRRHPAVAGVVATAFLGLSIISMVLFVSAGRIEVARSKEKAERLVAQENLYAADMEVVAGAFSSALGNDVRDTRLRLEASRPKAGETDLRGFEWRYYWLRNRSEADTVFRDHPQVVDAVLASTDGSLIASHSIDGRLCVWEAGTGAVRWSVDQVERLGGFSGDGRSLVFSRFDRSIRRLELGTGVLETIHAPTGRLIALRPDGLHVVVLGPDKLPHTLALDQAAPPDLYDDVPPDTVAVVSSDGGRVAVVGRPYAGILVFDLRTGEKIAALIDPRPVIALALSPDGSRLVSGGFDSVLKVWDVDRGVVEHAFKPFFDPCWGLAFSPDGRALAAGGHNRQIKVFNTDGWEESGSLDGHESTIRALAFSSDSDRLISGAEDELAMVWSLDRQPPPDELRKVLRGPDWVDATPGLAFSPDSRLLAGTAADKTVKVWRTDTLAETATYPGEARTLAFSPNGEDLLCEGFDGEVQRWSVLDPRLPAEPVPTPSRDFSSWQMDPLSLQQRVDFIAGYSVGDTGCRLCEIPNARDSLNAGSRSVAVTLARNPDGRSLYAGLLDGSIEVWDVDKQVLRFRIAAHKLPITAIAISNDGRTLATGSLDNSTGIWDATSGQLLARILVHNRPVWALAFSPDGNTLAAGSCDKAIVLCSVPLRRHVATLPLYTGTPEGYEQEVRLLRFSPDGNILAAALGDGSLRFFRAAPFAVTDAP